VAKKTLLRGGSVVTMDRARGEYERADVLIEGAHIAAVEPDLDVDADETIAVAGKIVMPGLIDCHTHLWQTPVRGLASGCWGREYFSVVHPLSARYRPEDVHAATYGGAMEFLSHGVTTVLDFCHSTNSPEHADASVDALIASGIRAFFGYGFRDRPEVDERHFESPDERVRDVQRLYDQREGSDGGRVRLAVALNNIEHIDAESQARELGCARDLGIKATVHSNLPGQVSLTSERDLFGPDILWVHCGAIADPELELLSDTGGAVISSPEIEAGLMAVTPVIGRALRHSVPVGIGVDIPTAVSGDLLCQARIAFALNRLLDAQLERIQGREPRRTPWSPTLDARRMLELATIDAARILGIEDQTGSVTPGKLADLLVLSTDPFGVGGGDLLNHVLFQASVADVDSVFVAGEARVSAGRLVDIDERGMRRRLDEARDWVLGRSPGAEWPELTPAAKAMYEDRQGAPVA